MDKIEKIRQEIERLRRIGGIVPLDNREQKTGYESALIDIELFLDSLESEEPDKSLEEAAEEYRQGEVDTGCDYIDDSDGDSLYHSACLADAFIAGAKWQAEKCDEETSKLLYAERQTAYINGWDDHKEQMMKDAVEGEVVKDISNKLAVTAKINLDGFKFGDKVRIIIVKED